MKKHTQLFMLLCIFILASCSTPENTEDKTNDTTPKSNADTLVIGIDIEPEFINPVLDESEFDHLIYRGLMAYDENNEAVFDIATSFDRSNDGLTYTFSLDDDVVFSDGTPLTADDVVFTFSAIFDDNVASMIRPTYEEISRVEKTGEHEVVFTLKKPFPPLFNLLTLGILPKHLYDGKDMNTAPENAQPIGTGPYVLTTWDRGNKLVLQTNERAQKKPVIEKVIFKYIPDHNVRTLQLQTGEIDVTLVQPSQVEKLSEQKHVNIYNIDTADYRTMMFQMDNPLWEDVKVRQAFSYAIDRQAVVDGLLLGYGFPAYSPLQLNPYNNEAVEKYSYDLQRANELLDASGWILQDDGYRYKEGEKLAFTIVSPSTDETRGNIATYLASQYKELGADVKTEALDWSVLQIEETDAFILGWGSPFDADDHTYKLFHSNSIGVGYNYGSYQNDRVDTLLAEARVTTDDAKRKQLYEEFQVELAKDPAYAFIAYLKAVYGVNKRVDGVVEKTLGHHGAGFMWNLSDWTLNE